MMRAASLVALMAVTASAYVPSPASPMARNARGIRLSMSSSPREGGIQGRETTMERRGSLMVGVALLVTDVLIPKAVGAEEGAAALQQAKKALDPIEEYIKDAQWDKCRTALNNPPLGFTGTKSIKGVTDIMGKSNPAVKGMASDLITNQRLLDTFCYNNVFVDEGRQALGLKVDFKTPLMYLKETQRALNEMIELVGE